jgi:HEAT repeat protein
VQVTNQEQRALQQRSIDLLLRAVDSEIDVVSCNAIEALRDIAPNEAVASIRRSLQSESPMVRFAACAALGELRDNASIRTLRERLSDGSARVQLAAAFALYRCGESSHGRMLVATLNDSPEEAMRSDAAYLIGRIGDPKAVARLRAALKREKSNRVIVHILTAMALLNDRDGLEALIDYAQFDSVSRLLALQGLAELGNPRGRDVLMLRFNDKNDYVQTRLLAARGLGRIGVDDGYRLAMDSLDHKEADADETMRVRSLAALALGAIGDKRALPALQRLAESETDMRTQVAACYAIGQIVRGPTK